MVTIFSIPKPFNKDFSTIQSNAIKSWMKLTDDIILFGHDERVTNFAEKHKLTNAKSVLKNEYGTPIMSDVFEKIKQEAKYSILAYVNADVILFEDFLKTIRRITFKKYLLIAKRKNILLNRQVKYQKNYREELNKKLINQGRDRQIGNSSEFFVFPKIVDFKMPDFATGRLYWDSWLIYKAKCLKIPVVDGSDTISYLHQIHNYSHHLKGKEGIWFGPEAKLNFKLSGGETARFKVTDADWITTPDGLTRPKFTFRRLVRKIRVKGIINPEINFFCYPAYLIINIVFKLFMLAKVLSKRGIYTIIDLFKNPDQIEYKFKEL